jgi:SAM-dependent methyltransferase
MSIINKRPNEIKEIIKKHLPVKNKQKEEHGEVFTPIFYLEEMLDTLPSYVWSNPNLKWLDPANGIGNFPMLIFEKLMRGLEKKIPNKAKRAKHIIENMLFMIEIDESNVKISREIFGSSANIYKGSFLDNPNPFPNVKHFDIIIGNPPYNEGGTKSHGKKNIYVAFVQESLRLLSPGGYLLFIHPSNWRTPKKIKATGVDLNAVYTNLSLHNVIMYPQPKIIKDMGVMMSLDVVLVQNRPFSGEKTKITDINGKTSEVVIQPHSLIPNYGPNILEKMAKKVKEVGKHIDLVRTSEAHKQFMTPGKHKNIHGIVKKGIKICTSNDAHSDAKKPKLLINGIGSHNYVFNDNQGKYGFTQNMVAVLKPSPQTKLLIESKLFQYLANATKIIGNNFNIETEKYLPFISKSDNVKTPRDLYRFFGFTEKEIHEIDRTRIPHYANKFLGCTKKKRNTKTRTKKTKKKRI